MKSVCIVGAGPAGLVAAKTFLQTGQFAVSIFEKKDRLGGIWAIQEDTRDGFLSPQTPTNLSRFTVAFSDIDWQSIDLRSNHDGRKTKVPMFPKAWQVNRYLQTYQKKFVPADLISFNTQVVDAQRTTEIASGAEAFWRVSLKHGSGVVIKDFDRLVVASGFFSKPRPLSRAVTNIDDNQLIQNAAHTIHTSEFKTLEDLFGSQAIQGDGNILVIGGGNSGGEAAAAVATQLSDALWSPDASRRHRFKDCKVVHVVPRPLYALPPYVEYENGSRTYVPIDFKLYDYSRRPPGPITSYAGQQPPEVRNIAHNYLQGLVGGDQADLNSDALVAPSGQAKGSAYVALSESYPEFVRSGLIQAIKGRVSSINPSQHSALIDDGTKLENIGAIIYATGYTPSPALDFLAVDIKETLHHDSESMRLPLILEQWQTMSSAVPTLSFLGFYEGPYWGIIEMQAKLTCQRWLGSETAAQRPFEERDKLLELRQAMKAKADNVPQFWFGDYLGYMEDMAKQLSLTRNDRGFEQRQGNPSMARFSTDGETLSANNDTVLELQQVWRDCLDNGKYVARAVFRALQGRWKINRRISSRDQNYSGLLEGEASFHPRFPTQDRSSASFDFEYLYIETGTFISASGLRLQASRRYVYRYSEADDRLSVWFVKPEADYEVDYLFHNLEFLPPSEAKEQGACVAKADHLCVDDMYWTQYRVPLKGIWLPEFELRHRVQGPAKDYTATTQFTRPAKNEV